MRKLSLATIFEVSKWMGESEKLAGIRDAQLMFGTNSRHVCSNKESPALVFVALLWSNVEIPKGDYLYTHFLSSRTSFFWGGRPWWWETKQFGLFLASPLRM